MGEAVSFPRRSNQEPREIGARTSHYFQGVDEAAVLRDVRLAVNLHDHGFALAVDAKIDSPDARQLESPECLASDSAGP